MSKKTLQQVIKEYKEFGFSEAVIEIAYANVDGNEDRIIDEITRLQDESAQYPTKPSNPQDEDAQLSKAIQMSINEAKDKKITLEPLNPEQRIRKTGDPVGLKNIGNTCYFNSILQTYFQNVEFVRSVLSYDIPDAYKPDKKSLQGEEEIEFKRKQASCTLVEKLKILFMNMIASDRKYVDPTDVVTSIVDDYGNQLPIGDQKDIGEFNLVFLSRIDEGLQLVKKKSQIKEMKANGESHENSPSKIKVFGEEGENQHRLLQRSSIKIQQDSIINQQFIGTMQNFYINETQKINKSEDQQFSLLFVNVKNKELYKALEEITIQHIDDYRNQKGEVVGVQKQSWIKVAPKTLFFQIDRVIFNKETLQLQKINDEFDFPLTFYLDPFLLKNKEQALNVQKKVRKLRNEKERYVNALREIEKFGSKNLNLLDLLEETTNFLSHQKQEKMNEDELESPLYFPNLAKYVTEDQIKLLKNYRDATDEKIKKFQKKIQSIEKQIQDCYASIKSTPYHLYSLLIHEGSADSGHYYSYTYDILTKKWRKYNDINITEEAEQQIAKEARGVNYTSAYYLVYAKQEVLVPKDLNNLPLRNHEISSSDNYMNDYYSSLLTPELKNKIKTENSHMYMEIEQYKMGSFANRVVENYTKKFETCNEVYRKYNKQEKKKSQPPNLTNLPIFLKHSINQEVYKTSLIQIAISEFGPKERSAVFEDLLKKKMGNFNDFKKPKNYQFDQKHAETFMRNVYKTVAAQKLYEALNNEQYNVIHGLIKELDGVKEDEYFNWLLNLLCKVLVVTLMIEAENLAVEKNFDKAMERLRYLTIYFSFVNIEEEKSLLGSSTFWLIEIDILFPNEEQHKQISDIIEMIKEKKYSEAYENLISGEESQKIIEEIKSKTDINDALWNLSRHENTLVDQMLKAREGVKGKMQVANGLYKQMKKKNIPLSKGERDSILKSK